MKSNLLLSFLFCIPLFAFTQQVTYSEAEKVDALSAQFEIIGKVNNNFLVYKNVHNRKVIAVYDNDMKLKTTIKLGFLAENITYLNFIPYSTFCIVIFQTPENNKMYCKAAKIDDNGNIIGQIKVVDVTTSDILLGGESYSVIVSENKSQLLFSRRLWGIKENKLQLDEVIVDENLTIKKTDHYFIPFILGKQFISSPSIDNKGNVVFITWEKSKNDNSNLTLYKSPSDGSDLVIKDITVNKYGLSNPIVQINNEKDMYYIVSLFKNAKNNNVGLLSMIVKSDLSDYTNPNALSFIPTLKTLASKNIPSNEAFNNYHLSDFIFRKDGGFVITADFAITRTTGNSGGSNYSNNTRYEPFNTSSLPLPDPYYSNYDYDRLQSMDRSLYSFGVSDPSVNYSNNNYSSYNSFSEANVMTFSFNKNNNLSTINSLKNSTSYAYFDHYTIMNVGNQAIFIYNAMDKTKKYLLNSVSLGPDGTVTLNPLFRNLDKGYFFLLDGGKQVDEKTMIIPCRKNQRLAIAKITFD